ncbi:winged helix-turn-helix transcriptional regulator [Xanthomonas graminis]|uniref:winged helix-turn-helix transcriptional regulator n=1 Tax=Xanthomonas graminis TaxID=3390026 RepID=UPI000AD68FE6|nr:winged helix-turn-helix transcriptional regulator [Xanthomonas translucens]
MRSPHSWWLVQPLGVMTARVDTARSKPGACCAARGASAASDVSQRMLAQTLRGLQHEGLVARALLPLVAPGLAQDQRGAVAESPGGDVAEIHRPLAH